MVKDYSLTGSSAQKAHESGLSSPNWYRTEIDPSEIRKLMQKSDARAFKDAFLWIALLLITAYFAVILSPSLWSLPLWFIYGVLYGSASDARWHECGHNTAFKTQWMNDVIYHSASFMLMRNPYLWRASHIRHHTDTIIIGRDPEIVAMRPPDLMKIILNLFGIIDGYILIKRMLAHGFGRLSADEKSFTRKEDHSKIFRIARIWLCIYIAVIYYSLATSSLIPLLLIGLPRFYGAWHHVLTGLLQHLGLAENVTDHRLNTRTVLMNPITRFIYLNMNYHLEHHMFTMIPYYHLPKLHALIKHDTPAPDKSIYSAFRRLLPVLWKQLHYQDAVIIRNLPKTATPYRDEVKALLPHAV